MKKIILSLAVIGAVGAVVVGGTLAYFSSKETSTGNIFTAGTLDLTVDHAAQTYDGIDCKTCSKTIVSDTTNVVVSGNGSDAGNLPHNAVLITVNPAWATITGADWIWATNPTTDNDAKNQVSYAFQKTFDWFNPAISGTFNMNMAADNGYAVVFNGNPICSDAGEFNYNHVITCAIPAGDIIQGSNTLQVTVTNLARPDLNGTSNPAGLIYSLTINGDCSDHGQLTQIEQDFMNTCKLWSDKHLTEGDTFFNFGDIKPGDWGTNLISMRLNGNDGWACMFIKDKETENVLSDGLNVVVWNDSDHNGVYEAGEAILYNGLLSHYPRTDIPVADSGHAPAITGNTTQYLGLEWCAGTETVDTTNGIITCDGSTLGNDAQGQTLSADLILYAIQQRNNSGFTCAGVTLP